MTFTKASTLALGIVGAFALGVWTGPSLTEAIATSTPVEQAALVPASTDAPQPAARATRAITRPSARSPFAVQLAASAPAVQQHAKSVLSQGTNVEMAADGFSDAELFVSTAYAARNTKIPFVLLKHRMLTEGQTLSEAIRMSKPELDAVIEMDRARTKARAVIAVM